MSNVLENLLLPVNHDDFIRNIWQTRFECGSPITGRYRKLCDWAALNRILTEQRLVPPRLRLFRNGQQVDPHSFQRRQPLFLLRTECLLNELRNGATLILDVVDEAHEPLRDLSRNLRSSLGAPVHVNLYAAWKRDLGFNAHYDVQENLILQIHGRKYWKIWKPSREAPLTPEVLQAGREPDTVLAWEGFLEDGGWLYIPRGWWHVAHAVDEPSMHLTVTITPFRTVDFLGWILDSCKSHSDAGRYIPLPTDDRSDCDALRGDCLRSLKSELQNKLTSEAMDRFLSEALRDWSEYPQLSLPILEPDAAPHTN